jgi:hypothetical protein
VAGFAGGCDFTGSCVQGCEQGGSAVAGVVRGNSREIGRASCRERV